MLCCVWLFVTLRTVAHQSPLSMGFSRQEYWSGCHFLLRDQTQISCTTGRFFTIWATREHPTSWGRLALISVHDRRPRACRAVWCSNPRLPLALQHTHTPHHLLSHPCSQLVTFPHFSLRRDNRTSTSCHMTSALPAAPAPHLSAFLQGNPVPLTKVFSWIDLILSISLQRY